MNGRHYTIGLIAGALAAAQHNHEKPQGAYDHARAIAKADAALGYAKAADIFHFKLMQK